MMMMETEMEIAWGNVGMLGWEILGEVLAVRG